MKIQVGTGLSCGCCGSWFNTWEGYEDQDQDMGYGICKSCQGDIEDRNKATYKDIYEKILTAVKPDTKAKMEAAVAKDPDMLVVYANMALEQGFVKWSIG